MYIVPIYIESELSQSMHLQKWFECKLQVDRINLPDQFITRWTHATSLVCVCVCVWKADRA